MSINDFKDHNLIGVSAETMIMYRAEYTEVDYNDKQYDDPKYKWKMVYRSGYDQKYGRMMVSDEFKLRRGLTMGEFYGSGEVD